MRFIDEVEFTARSGDGGNGRVGFRREAKTPRGGPNGGDGGRGGSVIFEATTARNTLSDFRRNKLYRAPDGEIGGSSQCTGHGGADLVLLVPVGTILRHRETDEIVIDLAAPGDRWEIPGGRGGRGNQHFATSTRQTPTFAEEGRHGKEFSLRLELKLIADVGLLGFPNAGKSTLISRISAARPKVADYPFTTLIPHLGVVDIDLGASFVVADMPGLIEGASQGAGLGHQFLRHVERCALYVHMVAPDADVPPAERLAQLDAELAAYDASLLKRPQIVVLSKIDLLQPDEIEATMASLRARTSHPVLAASAATGVGIKALVQAMWDAVQRRGDAQ